MRTAQGKIVPGFILPNLSNYKQKLKAHLSENIEDMQMPEQHRCRSRPKQHFYVTQLLALGGFRGVMNTKLNKMVKKYVKI